MYLNFPHSPQINTSQNEINIHAFMSFFWIFSYMHIMCFNQNDPKSLFSNPVFHHHFSFQHHVSLFFFKPTEFSESWTHSWRSTGNSTDAWITNLGPHPWKKVSFLQQYQLPISFQLGLGIKSPSDVRAGNLSGFI